MTLSEVEAILGKGKKEEQAATAAAGLVHFRVATPAPTAWRLGLL
jgi:hypothetical protein